MKNYICKCGRLFDNSQSFNSHKRWCEIHKGIGNVISNTGGWNRGLTKEIDKRLELSAEAIANLSLAKTGGNLSQEHKKKLSKIAKERGFGGHTSKQKLYFKKNDGTEVYLQSSFEIRYAELLEENNIDWIRPSPLNWIDANGEDHRYYGDFYLTEFNLYIDTKNDYLIIKDAEKIKRVTEQNNVNLKVLSSRELGWLPKGPQNINRDVIAL